MTTRERWLTAALILCGLALVVLELWQQVRYADARNAVRRFMELENRLERETDEEEESRLALVRQARPEVRRSLARGDFHAALQRLNSLSEEDSAGEDPAANGSSIPIETLWKPNSPERDAARKTLRLLVEKQSQGYDLEPAQEALVRVAESARKGKRDAALAAFAEAEHHVRNAALRPGFKQPVGSGKPGAPGGLGGPALPPQVAMQLEMTFRLLASPPPQVLENMSEEQKALLPRIQAFGREAMAAYRQGKDVRVVMPFLQRLGSAFQSGDAGDVERVLRRARTALAAAPVLRAGAQPPVLQQPQPAFGGPAAPLPGPIPRPPALPPVGPGPGSVPPEAIMSMLDSLRRMPEPVWQQQRGRMAAMLSQVLGRPGGLAGLRGAAPAATVGIGEGARLRLEFGPRGELLTVRAAGQDLSAGLAAGGFSLDADEGPEVPIRAPARVAGKELAQQAVGSLGVLAARCREEKGALVLNVSARRDREGKPGSILLRLPVRAAGWRWAAGGEPQVIAVDGTYASVPQEGRMPGITLQGGPTRLELTAATASWVSFEPATGHLVVRLPVAGAKGKVEHILRLELGKGGDASAVPGR